MARRPPTPLEKRLYFPGYMQFRFMESIPELVDRVVDRCTTWAYDYEGTERFLNPIVQCHCILMALPNEEPWAESKEKYHDLIIGDFFPNEARYKAGEYWLITLQMLNAILLEAHKLWVEILDIAAAIEAADAVIPDIGSEAESDPNENSEGNGEQGLPAVPAPEYVPGNYYSDEETESIHSDVPAAAPVEYVIISDSEEDEAPIEEEWEQEPEWNGMGIDDFPGPLEDPEEDPSENEVEGNVVSYTTSSD